MGTFINDVIIWGLKIAIFDDLGLRSKKGQTRWGAGAGAGRGKEGLEMVNF